MSTRRSSSSTTSRNVKEVVDKVEALGLRSRSIIEFIERQRLTYLLIFGGMTCVAAVALLVSSLGIANTMLMSVLERRREIGIMKAVGAANWQLQALFVIEGGLIGLVGGSLGLLLAWSISFPGDGWVRSMVHRDMKIDLNGLDLRLPGLDRRDGRPLHRLRDDRRGALPGPARREGRPGHGTPARLIGLVGPGTVPVPEPTVTSVLNYVEPRACSEGASDDLTEAG